MRRLVAGILVGCVACVRGPATTAPVVATMVREECLEDCPVYEVTLYRDGVVEYRGRRHVKATGRRVGRVTAAAIAELEAELARVGFARLRDYPHMDCTDLPGVRLTYQGKTLDHYHGDIAAPMDLFALEATFDRVAETARWVGNAFVFVPWCGSDGKPAE